jgi:colanic acid/amylovoran biosynthesis protein
MKSLKLCLAWHNLGSANFGVGALAIAHIELILQAARQANVQIEIATLGTPLNELSSSLAATEQHFGLSIEHHPYSLKPLVKDALALRFSKLDVFRSFDLIFDIGEGDSFSDIYGAKRFLIVSSTKFLALLHRKKIVLSPQTFGPFKKRYAFLIAQYLMRRCSMVFARDKHSGDIAEAMGAQVNLTADVAFSLPYSPRTSIARSVGINVSALLWNGGYSGKNQFGLKFDYKKFILAAVQKFVSKGCQVHLIAHVVSADMPVEDDFSICLEVKNTFKNEQAVVLAPRFSSPIEAKSYISGMEFFTGSRMHATIAAVSAGVATVPIAYSRKFSGVFESLNYGYTLNAYSNSEEELLERLFKYYDEELLKIKLDAASARDTALKANSAYAGALVELIKSCAV